MLDYGLYLLRLSVPPAMLELGLQLDRPYVRIVVPAHIRKLRDRLCVLFVQPDHRRLLVLQLALHAMQVHGLYQAGHHAIPVMLELGQQQQHHRAICATPVHILYRDQHHVQLVMRDTGR